MYTIIGRHVGPNADTYVRRSHCVYGRHTTRVIDHTPTTVGGLSSTYIPYIMHFGIFLLLLYYIIIIIIIGGFP